MYLKTVSECEWVICIWLASFIRNAHFAVANECSTTDPLLLWVMGSVMSPVSAFVLDSIS